jgi:hypothetical protein
MKGRRMRNLHFEGTLFFIFYLWRVEINGQWWGMVTFLFIPVYLSR